MTHDPYKGAIDAMKTIFVPEGAAAVPLAVLQRMAALWDWAERKNHDDGICFRCGGNPWECDAPDCELAALRAELAAYLEGK